MQRHGLESLKLGAQPLSARSLLLPSAAADRLSDLRRMHSLILFSVFQCRTSMQGTNGALGSGLPDLVQEHLI